MSESKLSDDLEYWRNQRPSQWKMDEFIHKALILENRISELEAAVDGDDKTPKKKQNAK